MSRSSRELIASLIAILFSIAGFYFLVAGALDSGEPRISRWTLGVALLIASDVVLMRPDVTTLKEHGDIPGPGPDST